MYTWAELWKDGDLRERVMWPWERVPYLQTAVGCSHWRRATVSTWVTLNVFYVVVRKQRTFFNAEKFPIFGTWLRENQHNKLDSLFPGLHTICLIHSRANQKAFSWSLYLSTEVHITVKCIICCWGQRMYAWNAFSGWWSPTSTCHSCVKEDQVFHFCILHWELVGRPGNKATSLLHTLQWTLWLQLNWPFLYVWLWSWLSLNSKHVVILAAGCHFHSLLHCLDILFVFLFRFQLLLFHLIGPMHLFFHVLEHRSTVWTPNKVNKASKFYSQTT